MSDIVALIKCRRCSQEKPPHKENQHLCEDCVKAENNRVSYLRRHNFNWMDVAKEAGLELWERQPGETDWEYTVWMCYRDAYPGKRPTIREVAEQLGTTTNAVRKIANRWNFPVRMQAWIKHVDELTLEQRRKEIIEMNKKHIELANKVHEKILKAVENLDPYAMSAKDISSLMRLSTELERKARLTEVPQAPEYDMEDNNPELKKQPIKSGSIKEIVEILAKSGILSNVGVRQTVTTEVVVKDE